MSVVEGVFLPQEVALLQGQLGPLLRLDPPGAQALQAAKARETAPEAEAQTAAPEKSSKPDPIWGCDIS